MARTSKTVIGGGSGEQSDRMMRAAASGHDAVARARSERINQANVGMDQANQNAALANQIIGQGVDRNIQQQQFDRAASQRDDALELEGAKAGFERGGAEQGQEPGSRAAQLEAEMQKGQSQPKIGALDPESQQRLNKQTEQGLEMDGHGRWRPTAERTANMERENKRQDFQADTERIRAEAYRDQVGIQAQKAYAAGNMEGFEEAAKESASYANSSQKLYDRFKDGDIEGDDWAGIAKAAKGSEQFEPSLMADIEAKNASPRVLQFLRAQIQVDALKSIIRTGTANYLKIDETLPMFRAFQDTRNSINDFSRANPALAATAMIRSTADKMLFVNRAAALQVYMGMSQPPSPSGGMTPAMQAGGGGAGSAPMGQAPGGRQMGPGERQLAATAAVRGARQAGDTPQQALQAGQAIDRTNTDMQGERQPPPVWGPK